MNVRRACVLSLVGCFAVALGARAEPASRAAVSPLSVEFFDAVVADARVVALGEPTHGAHEPLHFRNQLFTHLVERHGFTAIAVESDFVDGTLIDDYVMGRRELTTELIAGAFSFSAPEAATENRQLLEWMRGFNDRAGQGRKIRFYGIEMMGRSLDHPQPTPERALLAALDYLESVDASEARRFRDRLQRSRAAWSAESIGCKSSALSPYSRVRSAVRDAYTLTLSDLLALFSRRAVTWIEKSSSLAYERGHRNLLNAQALDADLRANGWWGCSDAVSAGDPDQRDATSARNVLWALGQEGERGRILLFAHAVHIRKSESRTAAGRQEFTSLGQHLSVRLGRDFVAIGAAMGDDAWGKLFPVPRAAEVAVNLRTLSEADPARTWWDREIVDSSGRSLNPFRAFDALLFFPAVTPWKTGAP